MKLGWSAVLALAWALLLVPHPARADAAPAPREWSEAVHTYFDGERRQAWLFVGMGLVSASAGGVSWGHGSDAGRAAAIPLFAGAAIELAIGLPLLLRTTEQVRVLEQSFERDPAGSVQAELRRMASVRRLFHVVLALEGLLVLGGLATAVVGVSVESDGAVGAGLGLAAVGATAVGLDYAAYERAERYVAALRHASVLPSAEARSGTLSLTVRQPF